MVNNYDPYLDGKSSERMVQAALNYIDKNGVPTKRKVGYYRRRKSKKIFGKIKK